MISKISFIPLLCRFTSSSQQVAASDVTVDSQLTAVKLQIHQSQTPAELNQLEQTLGDKLVHMVSSVKPQDSQLIAALLQGKVCSDKATVSKENSTLTEKTVDLFRFTCKKKIVFILVLRHWNVSNR